MPFSVQPTLVHGDDSSTIDLIAGYGFNRAFTDTVKYLNKRFRFCKITTISDTQTSFTVNKGQEQKDLLCILYFVFVVVSDYNSDITKAWKTGLKNILSKMSKLVFSGVDQVPDSRENLDLLELVVKWSLDDTLFLPDVFHGVFRLQSNLDLTTEAIKKIASLEKENILVKLFNSSEIKAAKSLLVKIDEIRQKLSLLESEADNLQAEISDYKKLERFTGISFEEVQEKAKRLQDLDKKVMKLQLSYCKIFDVARKLASDYGFYLFYW